MKKLRNYLSHNIDKTHEYDINCNQGIIEINCISYRGPKMKLGTNTLDLISIKDEISSYYNNRGKDVTVFFNMKNLTFFKQMINDYLYLDIENAQIGNIDMDSLATHLEMEYSKDLTINCLEELSHKDVLGYLKESILLINFIQ